MSFNEIKPGTGHLDYLVSKQIIKTLPFWKKLNVTPNILTTFGLISSVICLYALTNRKTLLAIIMLCSRWYFDYADGLMARKYKMVTVIGDYYDHITDIIFTIGLFSVILLSKYPKKSNLKKILVVILLSFYFIFTLHYSAVELEYYKKNKKETMLSKLRHIAPNNIELFKYFDNSVLYLSAILVIFLFCNYNNI